MAERRVCSPEVSSPLGEGRQRPFGITAAAVILILLSSVFSLVLAAAGRELTGIGRHAFPLPYRAKMDTRPSAGSSSDRARHIKALVATRPNT